MKTYKTLILFLALQSLIPSIISAQSYNSIYGSDSTKWEIPFCNLDQGYIREQISKEDTVVNGNIYKKVGTFGNNSIDYSMNGGQTNGLTREDTISGKAWFMGAIETVNGLDTIEFLIMDLSLNINDAFVIYESFGDSSIAIIDSIYTISGSKYVRTNYVLQGGNQKLTFIEGVGTNYGLNYMHDTYNMCPCLRTYEKDNSQIYINSQCSPVSGIDKEVLYKNNISIYPHPISSRGTFKFENPNNIQSELIIFNSLGQTVYTYRTNNNYFEINNKLHLKGTYFFKLIIAKQFLYSGKISFTD